LRDPDFATRYPQIPLRDIVAMRNRLSHGYFAIDLDIIWKAVRKDVPALRAVVQQV
jgi:uncharacterized protein with HEPN domain